MKDTFLERVDVKDRANLVKILTRLELAGLQPRVILGAGQKAARIDITCQGDPGQVVGDIEYATIRAVPLSISGRECLGAHYVGLGETSVRIYQLGQPIRKRIKTAKDDERLGLY